MERRVAETASEQAGLAAGGKEEALSAVGEGSTAQPERTGETFNDCSGHRQ
jgi:hypothetical protein